MKCLKTNYISERESNYLLAHLITASELKNQKQKYLLAHFDDNIRITGSDISNSKVQSPVNMNPEKTH